MLLTATTLAACGSDGPPSSSASTPVPATPSRTEVSATGAPDTGAPDTAPAGEVTSEHLVVPAPSLAGNLLGDPAELEVGIQLPASYASGDRRYPVVYFLAGFDEFATVGPIGDALQGLVEDGAAPEMIVVAVSGRNAFGGSFYVDSPVTGNWAQAITEDLVSAIDGSYRTLDSRDSRGIAGFSMGGFGALDLAMRHPDVFGAVYALSPGLFDPSGLADSQMFADPATVESFLEGQAELAAMDPEDAATAMGQTMHRNGDVAFSTAYGMAFSPDVAAGPPYVAYPYRTAAGGAGGARDDVVWQAWEAGYGGIADEVVAFADDLRSLRGIVVDYGVNDEYEWIPRGCEYFAAQMEAAGVPMRLEQYQGGHGPAGPRARDVMWPFFAEVLVTA